MEALILLFAAGAWAGAQNALAGGGSFVTLPALMLAGLDARAANITSAVALFPGQVLSGWSNREHVGAPEGLGFGLLAAASLIGGALGGLLLLLTPAPTFAAMLPWLVLAATALFAWGAFGPKLTGRVSGRTALAVQGLIGVYGGYFGGGIGFLMLAALTLAGMAVRNANATKNALAACMNLTAVAVFAFSDAVVWGRAGVLCAGALAGSWIGARLLNRVPERWMKGTVITIGLSLFAALMWRG